VELIQRPITEWKDTIKNDFEKSVFPKYPEIELIKKSMYDLGAVYASMSGSGSSVFGIFDVVIPENTLFDNYFMTGGILQ
jgi:4-diphosphocytidyl-2-C-methyl-D-erythritol kinase